MLQVKEKFPGVLLCFLLALPCWWLGHKFPVIGAPVFAIVLGMILTQIFRQKGMFQKGIQYTSKKILQYAVILLGFGLNLSEIAMVGATSLPIIVSTIATSLIVSYVLHRLMHMDENSSILIGVGSSICGGSAIAATAPVIDANDEEIAQAISVIFLFNVLAALIFPSLGGALGLTNEGFGLFAGTAVNDTSSVTAAAAAWDGMHPGANTLEIATIVKLTRTLAIIPITLFLAVYKARSKKTEAYGGSYELKKIFPFFILFFVLASIITTLCTMGGVDSSVFNPLKTLSKFFIGSYELKKIFPFFILFFVLASIITTLCTMGGVDSSVFNPLKTLSKFFIVMAMMAIGFNTDIVKLVKSGGKPIFMGLCCWICISLVSLGMQMALGLH